MIRRIVRIGLAAVLMGALAPRSAFADIISDDAKYLKGFARIEAGRFDDYCDHRRTIVAGDTLEKIALDAYGERARVANLLKANPGVVPEKLAVGALLLVPAKLVPPADAKETLAWRFYAGSEFSPVRGLERVFPGERFATPGKACMLVAIPAAKGAEFEQIVAAHADRQSVSAVTKEAPWAIIAQGFRMNVAVRRSSQAVESTTVLKIDELTSDPSGKSSFKLIETRTDYVDARGKRVEAGFAFFTEMSPLLLIALVGFFGLLHLRRRSLAARVR